MWARPIDMFSGVVDQEKYPDVEQRYRFELIDEGRKAEKNKVPA